MNTRSTILYRSLWLSLILSLLVTNEALPADTVGSLAEIVDSSLPQGGRNTPKMEASSVQSTDSVSGLYTRSFNVDNDAFIPHIEKWPGLHGTNIVEKLRDLSVTMGVELNAPKGIFFDEGKSNLLIRATKEELDVWEHLVQMLNVPPPLVRIDVKFVEIPDEVGIANFQSRELSISNNFRGRFSGILTDPQFRLVKRALEQRQGVTLLTMPEVITKSGRQAQIQMTEVMTAVKGIKPEALVSPGISATNDDRSAAFLYEQVTNGPIVDLTPYISPDEYEIQLSVNVRFTQVRGYDDDPTTSVAVYVNGKKHMITPPLPQHRTYEAQTTLTVWDGQTIVLGSAGNDDRTKVAAKGTKKSLMVFVTPTIVDSDGKRIHNEEDLPFAHTGIPVQSK